MQHQPLAFTLVKTVVTARDERRELSPALSTAWALMRDELSPAHRVMSEEVSWLPEQQHDLKFVIDGVRLQFERDPNLANEVLAFLTEVDTYRDEDAMASAFPVLAFTGSGPYSEQALATAQAPFAPPAVAPTSSAEISVHASELAAEEIRDAEGIHSPPTPVDTGVDPTADSSPALARASASVVPWKALFLSVLAVSSFFAIGLGIWREPSAAPLNLSAFFLDSTIQDRVVDSSEVPAAPAMKPPSVDVAEAAPLRAEGDYPAAVKALEARLTQNDFATASAKTQAHIELAQLYASQGRHLEAARTELLALERCYAEHEPSTLTLGRGHLRLSRYYQLGSRSVLAKAHLRQARHYFAQAQDIASAEELEALEHYSAKVLDRS